jgi:hypothetical protein
MRVVRRREHVYGPFTAYSVAFLLFKSGRIPMTGPVPLSNSPCRRIREPCGKQAHAYWPGKARFRVRWGRPSESRVIDGSLVGDGTRPATG